MSDALAAVHDGFAVALLIALPLLAAAVAGVLATAVATRALGLSDPTLGLLLRAVAVFAAIAAFGAGWAAQLGEHTRSAWQRLGALGRGP